MEDDFIVLMLFLLLQRRRRRCALQRPKSIWVHPIFQRVLKLRRGGTQARQSVGEYHTLFWKLKRYPDKFSSYTRMSLRQFYQLLRLVRVYVRERIKHMSCLRHTISTEERLAITLRFLATRMSFDSLSFVYRYGISTIHSIVTEMCEAIWLALEVE